MKVLRIETSRTAVSHTQTDGQVERYNHTIATQLRHYATEDPTGSDELLPILTLARWGNADRYMVEQVPVHYRKCTLPRACRNFTNPTCDQSPEHAQLVHPYGPLRPNTDGG